MRRRVKLGEYWKDVVYVGHHIIIQLVRKGKDNGTVMFVGDGHSLTLNEQDKVERADPGMRKCDICTDDVTVYCFYFKSFVAKLNESAVELAEFADKIMKRKAFKKLVFVGHSKAGLCIELACNYSKQLVDECVSISAPHQGTVVVEEKIFRELLNNRFFEYCYLSTFSNHIVDREISPASYVIDKFPFKVKCKRFTNIVSVIEPKIAWKHPVDLAMLYLDRRVGMYGDGIVSEKSQHNTMADQEVVLHCSNARSLQLGLEYIKRDILS